MAIRKSIGMISAPMTAIDRAISEGFGGGGETYPSGRGRVGERKAGRRTAAWHTAGRRLSMHHRARPRRGEPEDLRFSPRESLRLRLHHGDRPIRDHGRELDQNAFAPKGMDGP